MRELVFGTILVAAAGAGVYFMPFKATGERPAYAMSISEAKQLLAKADLRKGKQPFGKLDVLVTAPAPDVVRYEAGGTFAALDCRAKLIPVGDEGINVETGCQRASITDGAAAPAAQELSSLAFAEYIGSVLGQRSFDEGKLRAASSVAVMRNMPQMQRNALKMQREMADLQRDAHPSGNYRSGEGDGDWGAEEGATEFADDPPSDNW